AQLLVHGQTYDALPQRRSCREVLRSQVRVRLRPDVEGADALACELPQQTWLVVDPDGKDERACTVRQAGEGGDDEVGQRFQQLLEVAAPHRRSPVVGDPWQDERCRGRRPALWIVEREVVLAHVAALASSALRERREGGRARGEPERVLETELEHLRGTGPL